MEKKSTRPDFNYQMCILSVIGIFFMMLGHLKNDFTSVGTFYGWFPYYSFHMPLFFFISGYFYRDSYEKDLHRSLPSFLWKKIKALIIPYYVINGCFLIFQSFLHSRGIWLGNGFSLKEWLLQPWIRPEPYTLAHPTWFLIALFLSQIYFLLIRKLFGIFIKKQLVKEIVLLVFSFAVSCVTISLVRNIDPSSAAIIYLRSAYLMFYLQLGTFYKKILEEKDTVPGKIYLPIVFVIQLAIIIYTGNSPLYSGYALMRWYDISGFISLIAGINGIALWLRISRILSTIPVRSRLVMFIGDSTKYIMAFHLFGYFLVNCVIYKLYMIPEVNIYVPDFNPDRFFTEVYFACNANPRIIIIYFVVGLAFSLLVTWIIGLCRSGVRKISARRST